MSYIHLAQSRLGYLHEDGTLHPLKSSYSLYKPEDLYLLVRNGKEKGKQIIGGHAINDLVEYIEDYMKDRSDKSKEDYIGFKKRLKLAKSASLSQFGGLRYTDVDVAVQIAQERMSETYLYIRRHRPAGHDKHIDIVLDECISPHLREMFESEMTEVWPIKGGNTEGLKDKDVLKMAGRGILVTEDDDFAHAVRMIYVERVRRAGSSQVYMGDLPFVVLIESTSGKKLKTHFAAKARKMMREEIQQYTQENGMLLKADRRMIRAKISRSASKDFADTYPNAIQYKKFQTHKPEIIRLTDHEDRPHLGLVIRANGNVDYSMSRDRMIDYHFTFLPENVANVIEDNGLTEWEGRPVITVDDKECLYTEKADGRTARQIFEKIRLIEPDEIEGLIGSAHISNDASRKRYGRQKPYAENFDKKAPVLGI